MDVEAAVRHHFRHFDNPVTRAASHAAAYPIVIVQLPAIIIDGGRRTTVPTAVIVLDGRK